MVIAQKIKNTTTMQSSNSTPVYLFKENENINSKRYMHPYVNCSIIYKSPDMEAAYMPIDRWMDKNVVCITCTTKYLS